MKVLFIETQILFKEKLNRLIPCWESEGNTCEFPSMITLYNSPYTTENFLQELQVSKELIEELKLSNTGNELVIILNKGVRSGRNTKHLNYEFKKSGKLEYKNFTIDLDQEEVYVNRKRIKVTSLEYKLLLLFIYNAKKLIRREEIVNYLWSKSDKQLASEATVYTHIKNLKKKIIKCGVDNFIHSIYGQGYKFEDPDEIIELNADSQCP